MRKLKKDRFVIGLTGSFGSGKSRVAGIFRSLGARILDADKIAHSCINRGKPAYNKIISIFGESLLNKRKEIDRLKLGKIVFKDKLKLKKLNSIIHPEVIRIIKERVKVIKKGVIILDAPLLIEAGLQSYVDKLVVVKVDRDTQIKRLLKKKKYTEKEILRIIKSQIPLRLKMRLADFIIDNNGTLFETKKQVAQLRRQLWKS
ncbi:MAG: dephospho-CoA kinase [Candidatus Omnitrophica bacterium]|nr:dephospho-CoA kinase [Candidatus Omnitrophota bacterium]